MIFNFVNRLSNLQQKNIFPRLSWFQYKCYSCITSATAAYFNKSICIRIKLINSKNGKSVKPYKSDFFLWLDRLQNTFLFSFIISFFFLFVSFGGKIQKQSQTLFKFNTLTYYTRLLFTHTVQIIIVINNTYK